MRIRIGCVDGNTYDSMEISDEEILEELRTVDGKVGTGTMSHVEAHTVEDVIEIMSDMFKYDTSKDTQTITLMMAPNVSRTFNTRHVVWWEFRR